MKYLQCLSFSLFSAIVIAFFTACTERPVSESQVDPGFLSLYISAHVPEQIKCTDAVYIRFSKQAIAENRLQESVSRDVYRVAPEIPGKAIWDDVYTLRFKPDQIFTPDKSYTINVQLDEIFKKDSLKLKALSFDFTIEPVHMQVRLNNLIPSQQKENTYEIAGSIKTDVPVHSKDVEDVLKTKYGISKPEISWIHRKGDRIHKFVIANLLRNDRPQDLEISWDGKSVGAPQSGSRTLVIYGKDQFRVLRAALSTEGSREIQVQFSDILNTEMDITGLVTLNGTDRGFKTDVKGSSLFIYPETPVSGLINLVIHEQMKSTNGKKLGESFTTNLSFQDINPAVELLGKGAIIPSTEEVILPFRAINLTAIDVEIFKIFENNVLQFLQYSNLGFQNGYEAVGRVIAREKVELEQTDPSENKNMWVRYAIDLSKYTTLDPGSIYEVRIGFRKAYAAYTCQDDETIQNNDESTDDIGSIWQYRYDYPGYDYSHVDNPCYPAYYNPSRFVRRNVLASNLGLIAKSSDKGQMQITVQDLRPVIPIQGVQVAAFDFQQQLITRSTTNSKGNCELTLDRNASFIIAERGGEKGYLKVVDGTALPVSDFDIEGLKPQKGMKGFIYTERDVWRPGDTIFLDFVLDDGDIPGTAQHTVFCKLVNPKNQVRYEFKTTQHTGPVYHFEIPTQSNDLTGNWQASLQVGQAKFHKVLKIETIMPNRLKIEIDAEDQILAFQDVTELNLQSRWLHGAPAGGLKAKVEMGMRPVKTRFKSYGDFVFDDPARYREGSVVTIFEDVLDESGSAKITLKHNQSAQMPGKMLATIKTRVFEKGGAFSTDQYSTEYHPFQAYAGLSTPRDRWGNNRLDHDGDNLLELVAVDYSGKALSNRKISIGIYHAPWRWWWNRRNHELAQFNSVQHLGAFLSDTITTGTDGRGQYRFRPDEYGMYLIRVCDVESGHCSGDFVYSGYFSGEDERNAAARLTFSTDKQKYEAGENITLTVPSSAGSTLLVSIEDHDEVLWNERIEGQEGFTDFRFTATTEMMPNVYAHVHLIQEHGHGENDLPLRMYGVMPILIEDPETKLNPVITMDDVLKPEATFKVTIEERDQKPMSYTLAIVDEGLLDLTRFSTPDPWKTFYAKEALGVKTWDLYDFVIGGYGGQLERILSIGGDGVGPDIQSPREANRFKPVVKHIGPFYLKPGESTTHQITMPNYVGSVRTMVVASGDGKYGKAEKTTPVRNPVMVLATMPRVLAPGERISLPVQVFAMEEDVKQVTVSVRTNPHLYLTGPSEKTVRFSKPGDQEVEFQLEVGQSLEIGEVWIEAKSKNVSASQYVEIQVRNPNPYMSDVKEYALSPGQSVEEVVEIMGMQGTNEAILEVSSLYPVNLDKHLNYLIRYPYGCIEQTTSAAFPQLFVNRLIDLSPEKQSRVQYNIREAIRKMRNFLIPQSGFAYWPGSSHASEWGNNYGGHFLIESQRAGYFVDQRLIDSWTTYQTRTADRFSLSGVNRSESYHATLMQAYRLYTLALAGDPALGPMNRLRKVNDLGSTARFMLAAAYAHSGQPDIADELILDANTQVEVYENPGYTFGSSTRDMALIVDALTSMGKNERALPIAKRISDELSKYRWHSTQSTAWGLIALSKIVSSRPGEELQFTYRIQNSGSKIIKTSRPIYQIMVDQSDESPDIVNVENTGQDDLFVRLIRRGKSLEPDGERIRDHLKMEVRYTDMNGTMINPARLQQGTDFVASVQITNTGPFAYRLDEMALQTIFPSGWEIINQRMDNLKELVKNDRFEYQNIRDDRVYTFFNLHPKKKQAYRFALNAAYTGRYILPAIYCEAMYDHTIQAKEPGMWVEVVKSEANEFNITGNTER